MDASAVERLSPKEEFGRGALVDPSDCCTLETGQEAGDYEIAVADNGNGVLVFDRRGNIIKHLSALRDAMGLCYEPVSGSLVATVSVVANGQTVWKLIFIDPHGDWVTTGEFDYPTEPVVKPEFARWICADGQRCRIYSTVADNTTALLYACDFQFDASASRVGAPRWHLLWHTEGDLERPFKMPRREGAKGDADELAVIGYTDSDGWEVHVLTLAPCTSSSADQRSPAPAVASKRIVYRATGYYIQEPWNAVVDADGSNAYVQCARNGYVWRVAVDEHLGLVPAELVAVMPAGQVVGMALAGANDLWVACGSDRLLRLYEAKTDKRVQDNLLNNLMRT